MWMVVVGGDIEQRGGVGRVYEKLFTQSILLEVKTRQLYKSLYTDSTTNETATYTREVLGPSCLY